MSLKIRRAPSTLVSALAAVLLLVLPVESEGQVDRPQREIELVPRENMSFGSPYNTVREYALPRSSCVDFRLTEDNTVLRGTGSRESFWKRLESNATMAKHMNMSIDAHLKAVTPGGTYESDSKVTLLSQTRSHAHAINLYGSVVVKFPVLMLREGSYRLTDEALRVLEEEGERAFELRCGDAFVAGATRGYEFHARAHLKETSRERIREAKQATDQNWDAQQYAIDFLFQRGKRLESSRSRSDFEIKVVRTDPRPAGASAQANPTSFAQLERQFQAFMSNASTPPPMEQNFIRLHLVPYTLAANYPGEDFAAILDPPSRQDQLAEMIGALWDLRALREDAAFMQSHPEEFAMGWRDRTVRKWESWLSDLDGHWLAEFQALRERAQQCRSAGDGETDRWDALDCSEIAKAYNREEGSRKLLAERDQLPTRKSSVCRAPIPIDADAKTDWEGNIPLGFILRHTRGSHELQNGLPKILEAELAVRVLQRGRLARLLLRTSLEDCKPDGNRCRQDKKKWRTKLEGGAEASTVLYDLDDPNTESDLVGGLDRSAFADVSECVFHTEGPLSVKPLGRRGDRWIYGKVDDRVAAKSVKRCRPGKDTGCDDPSLLAEVPPDRKHRAAGQGALRSLTCVIDLSDKRDRRLPCVAEIRGGLKLRLLNELDVAAEERDPPAPRAVQLPHYRRGLAAAEILTDGPPISLFGQEEGEEKQEKREKGNRARRTGDAGDRPRPGRSYKIRSVATGKFVAVSGGHRRRGANIIQWEDAGQRNIVWTVRPGPGRTVKLQNARSEKFLAISGGKRKRGQTAIQWTDGGQRDVQWVLIPAPGGTFRLKNRGTDRFLGVHLKSKKNGANILQWHESSKRAMRWRFVPVP